MLLLTFILHREERRREGGRGWDVGGRVTQNKRNSSAHNPQTEPRPLRKPSSSTQDTATYARWGEPKRKKKNKQHSPTVTTVTSAKTHTEHNTT